jgi:heterotetrameric sarcosine oxidase delta subunit
MLSGVSELDSANGQIQHVIYLQFDNTHFMRDNPKGRWAERWVHAAGCRRWFNAVRDTASYRMIATYRQGEEPPQ